MAKSRASESASSRDRTPPPPRLTGIGLMQLAMFCGLGAILAAFLGVFMAGGTKDPTVDRHADNLGTAMAALLTAQPPAWWLNDFDTWEYHFKQAKAGYPGGEWPKIPSNIYGKLKGQDFQISKRNKERLDKIEDALQRLDRGTLRGVQIKFTKGQYPDRSVGARIDPTRFAGRPLGKATQVGIMTAEMPTGGAFRARVYHRPYRDPVKGHVGDAFVILSQGALDASGGGGMWLFLTPLLVAIAIGVLIAQTSKASEGLKAVARDLDTIGRGKLDTRVTLGGSGEVGYVQSTAARMAKNLQLIQTTGSGDLDEAIEKELDLANQIHQSLRPADTPRVPGYELETLFKPGRDIGGDYFDYVDLDEGRIALLIADCSEALRGVPAAMVMAMTRAYLKAAVDPDSSPAEWLRWVNRRLARDLKSGMAVTALCLVLDTTKNEVVAASAGHRPILLWRQGKTATVNPNGIALGLDVGPVFDKTIEDKKFAMQKNDRLVVYTDGVISAENEEGEAYGDARFIESIRRQGAMNSAAFVNFVAGAVDKFLAGTEQMDDVTISTLKRMK